ncbi:outer membrane protein assembly factor BamD [Oryzomonas japonica]|uniref:Outer membrane protein assembly factor BamD n=1 Tax=Oryzomonas japonica TaxID=2603858 RepID=A0A7J4ZS76_9BACT|nr:outer membrane protein assembly factor BamD [Oryzomonas japonica]KAB0666090.1 outer membrane protein assembly factor BamD [Oryzomonas japonica]
MKSLQSAIAIGTLAASLLQGCASPPVNTSPEELYKDGEQSFQKGRYENAVANWKKVKESYKSPELTAKAEIGIADAYFLNRDYIEAAAAYEDFRKLHPRHERADYALFRQGLSYYKQINRIDTDQTPVKNALAILESYLKLYPGGEHIQEAQERVRDCKDKQLQYEIYVGRFYLRTEKYPAAIARFEEALKTFSGLQHNDELLYCLGTAYQEAGQREKSREAFDRLVREFPGSTFAARIQKAAGK